MVVREAGAVEVLKELPCDAVILSGECVMQEASLTRESVPITKVCQFLLTSRNPNFIRCSTS